MVIGHDYRSYGYLSSMAVLPAAQRRGLGRALLDTVLAWFDGRGTSAIELDATPAGASLYRSRGFVDDGATAVYHGEQIADASHACTIEPAMLEAIAGLDAFATLGDRRAALRALLADPASRPFVDYDTDGKPLAYAVYRSTLIGPWIAVDAGAAARVFHRALRAVRSDGFIVCTQRDHAAAAGIVREAGLTWERELLHMRRGAAVERRADTIYGRFGLGGG